MPLRSPSGICYASANGSPEAIQEFVVRVLSRPPHRQPVWPSSPPTPSRFSHSCAYCLPFPTRHSGKAQCQRRALASAYLAVSLLLKTPYLMAQTIRLAGEPWFSRRGKSAGCMFLPSTRDSMHLGPQSEASRAFRNCFEQWLPHGFFSLLLDFLRVVCFSLDVF